MAGTGTIVNEFADTFPKINRGPQSRQRTDVDVALEQLEKEFEANGGVAPSRALKVIDYKVDAEGNPVDTETARARAQARVQAQRKRGYTKEVGWRLAAIDGCLWAQFYGEGNHPVSKGSVDTATATA